MNEGGAGRGVLCRQLLDVGVAAVIIDGDMDEHPADAAVALALTAPAGAVPWVVETPQAGGVDVDQRPRPRSTRSGGASSWRG